MRRFYQTALAHGGIDEGAPGIRANYNANYYGAFVRDPDGNKIEAVTHTARESLQLEVTDEAPSDIHQRGSLSSKNGELNER